MKRAALIFLALVLGGVLVYFVSNIVSGNVHWSHDEVTPVIATSTATQSDSQPLPVDRPEEPAVPLTQTYTNSRYRFSVKMPADFRANELAPDENGARAILLQNTKGDGVQILVTPDTSKQTTLTIDDVRDAIPDMRVVDAQIVEIGTGGTGVAFKSDNEAFRRNSREVWFYFNGNLYQISTYYYLDPLLQSMFGTWKFY